VTIVELRQYTLHPGRRDEQVVVRFAAYTTAAEAAAARARLAPGARQVLELEPTARSAYR
jgi:hypothetical protein